MELSPFLCQAIQTRLQRKKNVKPLVGKKAELNCAYSKPKHGFWPVMPHLQIYTHPTVPGRGSLPIWKQILTRKQAASVLHSSQKIALNDYRVSSHRNWKWAVVQLWADMHHVFTITSIQLKILSEWFRCNHISCHYKSGM